MPEGFIRPTSSGVAPLQSRGRITPTPEGTDISVAPSGGPGGFIAAFAALAVTVAAAWGLIHAGAPFIFPLVFGGFGLLFVVLFLWSAAGEVHVVIGSRGARLTYRLLGLSMSWTAAPGDAVEAGLNVTAHPGRPSSYNLLLRRRSGNPFYVFAALTDKKEAEWLVAEINRRLRTT